MINDNEMGYDAYYGAAITPEKKMEILKHLKRGGAINVPKFEDRIEYVVVMDEIYGKFIDGEDFSDDERQIYKVHGSEYGNFCKTIIALQKKLELERFERRFMGYSIFTELMCCRKHDCTGSFSKYLLQAATKWPKKLKKDVVYYISKNDMKLAEAWSKCWSLGTMESPSVAYYDKFLRRLDVADPEDAVETFDYEGCDEIYISTAKAFRTFFEDKIKEVVYAIDCEGGLFSSKTCGKAVLLQIACESWVAVLDVFLLTNEVSDDEWKTFFAKFMNPDIFIFGWSLLNDLVMLQRSFPKVCFDAKFVCLQDFVKNCSKIVAKPPAFKLVDAVKFFLNVNLPKDCQLSIWVLRPLSRKQIKYAADDAVAVSRIAKVIEMELVKQKVDAKGIKDMLLEFGRISTWKQSIIIAEGFQPPRSSIKEMIHSDKEDFSDFHNGDISVPEEPQTGSSNGSTTNEDRDSGDETRGNNANFRPRGPRYRKENVEDTYQWPPRMQKIFKTVRKYPKTYGSWK